jgi:hypothetical protein
VLVDGGVRPAHQGDNPSSRCSDLQAIAVAIDVHGAGRRASEMGADH